MTRIFTAPVIKIIRAKSRHEVAEFGAGKKDLLVCQKCGAYYFKKSWHHGSSAFLAKKENRNIPVKKILCPADQMIKMGVWEGEVIIENVPSKDKNELIVLIRNFCQRGFERDPLDRLISITEGKGNIVVRTTENQLAQKLGRKIKEVYKKVSLNIKHLKEPDDLTQVKLKFL
jgi:hypothetical protein